MGVIEYGVMHLAERLGCRDTKKSRVRAKMAAAAEAVCAAAPHEFPSGHIRQGVRDHVLVMRKTPHVSAPPLVVLQGRRAARRNVTRFAGEQRVARS
jgi:hypothetical protein